MDNRNLEECPCCEEMSEDVETRQDPFVYEIHGVDQDMTSCYECWLRRKEDI